MCSPPQNIVLASARSAPVSAFAVFQLVYTYVQSEKKVVFLFFIFVSCIAILFVRPPVILCFLPLRRVWSIRENTKKHGDAKWLGDDGEIVVELPRGQEEEDDNGSGGGGGGGGEREDGEANGKGKGKAKAKVRRFTAVRKWVDAARGWSGVGRRGGMGCN